MEIRGLFAKGVRVVDKKTGTPKPKSMQIAASGDKNSPT